MGARAICALLPANGASRVHPHPRGFCCRHRYQRGVYARPHGGELDLVFSELSGLTLEQRKQRVGLQPQRAGVINGGLIIQQEVLRAAQCDAFVASESDILQGIILTAARA